MEEIKKYELRKMLEELIRKNYWEAGKKAVYSHLKDREIATLKVENKRLKKELKLGNKIIDSLSQKLA